MHTIYKDCIQNNNLRDIKVRCIIYRLEKEASKEHIIPEAMKIKNLLFIRYVKSVIIS